MNREALQFIRAVLPKGRTIYYDFPDRYALLLLEQEIGDKEYSVSELKKTHLAPLLQKPRVKKLLSEVGSSRITARDLVNAWPAEQQGYRLTIGTWPGLKEKPSKRWSQVTRLGWSLVLQLNLPDSHKRELSKKVLGWQEYANQPGHPIAGSGELTLAWSRIDLDVDTGEALIEEIQSDWIRDVKYYAENRWHKEHKGWKAYYDTILKPPAKKWPETMLTATLWFLFEELGIKTVFYHTQKSGAALKSVKGRSPPRSLYSDLPRKFCFQTTYNGPLFIRDSVKRGFRNLFVDPETKWYIHDFAG